MRLTLLSLIRLIMFIFISYFYYTAVDNNITIQVTYIISVLIIFTINHFLLTATSFGEKHYPILIAIDLVVTMGYSFLFPGITLYLILVDVCAVTLFLMAKDSLLIWIFSISFFVVWSISMGYTYHITGNLSIINNLVNLLFVFFSAIVGRLIYKLTSAQEKITHQYDQLSESHQELQDAHQQLHTYSKQVEELTLIQERNRISREIHDTVGHKMTALLMQLQLAKELRDLDPKKSEATIELCEGLAREALNEIRLSVRTLQEDEGTKHSLLKTTRKILEDYQEMTGLKSDFHITGELSQIPPSIQLNLIRIIQESVTNAVRHGQATKCNVSIHISSSKIDAMIKDNGTGAIDVDPGFGLSNMRERVYDHGGTIMFESKKDEGFIIKVTFPLKEISWKVGDVK
ncbi:sensor histidine kinase YfiJ [Paraliobacillus quinghaiensis]|uniref:histidine kinase n=1 Tax=Paraliobacillus quinghaiensis TaxID=470815 RepID=A0A917WRR3_9BACI|nr:sensor histidine kinase YfiJ [Paraliobacillus quinghaiensis]